MKSATRFSVAIGLAAAVIAVFAVSLSPFPPSVAFGTVPVAGQLNLKDPLGGKNERAIGAGIITWLKDIALALLVVVVIVGGVKIMASAGNEEEVAVGKNILLYGAIGLGIIFLGDAILGVVRETLGY